MNKHVNEIIDFIKKAPKAELHMHIEGSLEPELMFKLAKKNNIKIPFKDINQIKSAYNFDNLQTFLNNTYPLLGFQKLEFHVRSIDRLFFAYTL